MPFKPNDISFLDIGCGKGRPLVIAKALGFRCVRGIDLIPEVAEVARKNLRDAAHIVTGDATEFEIPSDTNALYIANPFAGETLRRVLQNIERSYRKAPRRLVIIYFQPGTFERMSHEFSWMRKVQFGREGPWTYNLYEVT